MAEAGFDVSLLVAGYTASGQKSSSTFVFHLTIFFVSVIGAVSLFRLPRGLGLFGSQEWLSGHFLRHVPYHPSRSNSRSRKMVQAYHNAYPPPTSPASPQHQQDMATDDSHTLAYHYQQQQQSFKRLDAKGREIEMQYPVHIASCPSFLRWTLPTLRRRITPNYSVGQGIVLAMYFWVLVYATIYKSSFFVDYNRVGWLATAHIPLVMAYGAKNNVLGMLWGMGYEKLNFLHRFAGRMVIIGANLHGIGFAYKWSLGGIFTSSLRLPPNAWGLVALVCLDVLWLFSLAFWREKAYNLFLVTHVTCFAVLMPALWFHKPTLMPYILVTLGLFAFDYILRLLKTRVATATIRPLSELDLTRIEIPSINAGWRAGQHVKVRILSTSMGWFGWTEMHPFTIASVGVSDASGGSENGKARRRRSGGGGEGMVLMCKRTGRWTNRLFEMAKMSSYVDGWMAREVKVWIEGPYGGLGHTNFASFSAAVVIVGGSGITFGLSVVKDLIEKDLKGMSRVKAIELIWVTQDSASLTSLFPALTTLIHQSIFTPVRISVHYTRASSTPPSIPSIPGFTLSPGRPRISKIIDYAVSKALAIGVHPDPSNHGAFETGNSEKPHASTSRSNSRRDRNDGHSPKDGGKRLEVDVEMEAAIGGPREKEDIHEITGVIVGVCGPVELGRDVVNAVGNVDSDRRSRVGGIEVHEEAFGW